MSSANKGEYLKFDLLSPLQHQEEAGYIAGDQAVYETEDGKQAIELNEMRIVLGQSNKPFLHAMEQAFREVTSARGTSSAKAELLQYLDTTTGGKFAAAHLTSSGSEAVEDAVRLAKKLTGRTEVISFWNSIHGRTYMSASLSGTIKRKKGFGPISPGGIFFPYPHCAKCPLQKEVRSCGFACLELAKEIYAATSAQDAAAILVEPIQANGVIIPPPGYLKALQDWAKSQGILIIVDEIQCGMGRSGQLYCYQHEQLEPDMLLLGKALGNGIHIAALLTRLLPEKSDLGFFTGGSGDDPVACRAACEVFRQLETGLLEHIREVGETLVCGVKKLEGNPQVLECRGKGLAAAVEFRDSAVCTAICEELREKGFLIGQVENTLFCKPPYVLTCQQAEQFAAALEEIASSILR